MRYKLEVGEGVNLLFLIFAAGRQTPCKNNHSYKQQRICAYEKISIVCKPA
jgi:hypothetical protein